MSGGGGGGKTIADWPQEKHRDGRMVDNRALNFYVQHVLLCVLFISGGHSSLYSRSSSAAAACRRHRPAVVVGKKVTV